MPISFTCGRCGKGYLVSDGLAGKRATCKACDHRMVIPSPDPATVFRAEPPSRPTESRPTSARPEPVRSARPVAVAPAAKTTQRKPAPPLTEGDPYGLDETPAVLPPLMPRSATAVAEAPVKKKKKKKGFFASGKKNAKSSGGIDLGGLGGGLRLIWILVAVGSAVTGSFWLMSKRDMEAVFQTLIAQANQAASTLEMIHDPPTGHQYGEKARAELQAILDTLETHKNSKGRQSDIDALQQKYQQQIFSSFQRLGAAAARAVRAGGAEVSVKIMPLMTRHTSRLDQLGKDG